MSLPSTDPVRPASDLGAGARARVRRAVVLAGGSGTRVGPYATVLPKPLLPVGDRAVLDVVMRQLRAHEFGDVTVAVGYLAHLVEAVFGDGTRHGMTIRYQREARPLGTVGPLATIDGLDEPFLVMNGDALTTLDYSALYRAHVASANVLTIATQVRTVEANYGVLELDGAQGPTRQVVGFRERPHTEHTVSMGVYIVEPAVLRHIAPGQPLDLPDLVLRLVDAGEPVGSFLYDGLWLDLGDPSDYEEATGRWDEIKPLLLPAGADDLAGGPRP